MTTAVMSTYLENELIDHILRNAAYTSPGTAIWIALYTSDPTDADSGVEVSGGSYGRQQVTAWDAPGSTRATQNTNAITFTQASADWGHITHIGIRDAQTLGNLLFYGELTTHKDISSGDTFSIPAGDLDISLGTAISNYMAGKIIDHVLRNTTWSSPGTSIYSALYTSDPTAADVGTEVSGGAYARKQITAWDAPTDGDTENTNLEAFTQASGANWGTVTHTGLRDNSAAGNLLWFGQLAASKIVNDGDTFQWPIGSIDVTLT